MGCTSSKVVPADRRRLRSRSLSRAASALSSLSLCRCGRDAGVHGYARLSFEEMMKSANDHVAASAEKLTPPCGEPEVINAWEIMAGLEDAAPATPTTARRRASVEASPRGHSAEPAPVADFDPGILSAFRHSPEESSPSHPVHLLFPEQGSSIPQERKEGVFKAAAPAGRDVPAVTGIVRARIDAFQEKIEAKKKKAKAASDAAAPPSWRPELEGKVVVYFTSLRGVRKTFEDGSAVRAILRGFGARVDERDVSMHAGFKAELRELLGPGFTASMLPRVFVGRRHLGGADDVRTLHEDGALSRALDWCEPAPTGKLGYARACTACGDVRFVPCETCSGSCKLFVEDGHAEDGDRLAGAFRRCPDCNENGLIRCRVCCF